MSKIFCPRCIEGDHYLSVMYINGSESIHDKTDRHGNLTLHDVYECPRCGQQNSVEADEV